MMIVVHVRYGAFRSLKKRGLGLLGGSIAEARRTTERQECTRAVYDMSIKFRDVAGLRRETEADLGSGGGSQALGLRVLACSLLLLPKLCIGFGEELVGLD